MEASPAQLLDLLEKLLEAPDETGLGDAVLAATGDLVRPTARALYVFEPPGGRPRCAAAVDVSDLFLARYERSGRDRDPVLARALASGEVASNSDLMSAERWRETEAHQVAADIHRFELVMIAPVRVEGLTAATINIADASADRPATDRERETLALIARVTGLALAQRWRAAAMSADAARVAEAFDRAPVPLAITSPSEERPMANAAARQLLGDLTDPDGTVYELLRDTTPTGSSSRVVTATLRGGGRTELVGNSRRLESERGASVTRLERAGRAHSSPALDLLTPREREVVLLLVEGLTDSEMAARLQVSPHTVGQHLKRAYRKLNVRSRVAVVRMIVSGPE